MKTALNAVAGIPQTCASAGAATPIVWTSKPSRRAIAMQIAKTRHSRRPTGGRSSSPVRVPGIMSETLSRT